MSRLNAQYAAQPGGDSPKSRAARRAIGASFAREAENLLVKHDMAEPVAEYVRHVIRRGFDAEYDFMDPTDKT